MPISLIPENASPENTSSVKAAITEEQARAYLATVSTPKLDELRAKLPALRTSELLGLHARPEALVVLLELHDLSVQAHQEVFMAASLALADEIDRRIPIPK